MEGRCLQKAVTSRAARVSFVVHLGILELADNSPSGWSKSLRIEFRTRGPQPLGDYLL